MAACSAIPTTIEVFPMLGRAARIVRSPAWNPPVLSSRSWNPLGTPVIPPFAAWSCSIRSNVGYRIFLIQTKPSRSCDCATWKIRCSASSRICSTVRSPIS